MSTLISAQGQSANGTDLSSQMFATFDSNGDGQISKSEFDNAFSKAGVDSSTTDALFAKLDSNGDGSLSQSEMAIAKPGDHQQVADSDGPKASESSAGQSARDAVTADAGADGATTKTTTNSDGSTTTTISNADGTGNQSSSDLSSQMFATFDSNGDGQISKSEFDNAFSKAGVDSSTTDALFAKLDSNGDGSLSQSEMAIAKPGDHQQVADGDGPKASESSAGQSALDAVTADAKASDGTSNNGSSTATGNRSSSDLIEQLIKMQSQMLTAATSTLSTIA